MLLMLKNYNNGFIPFQYYNYNKMVTDLEKQLALAKADCMKTAEELHQLRLNAGKDLSVRIPQLLQKFKVSSFSYLF